MNFRKKLRQSKIGSIYRGIYKAYFTLLCKKNIEEAVKTIYKKVFGKEPNLDNPITINEKIQVLKLREYSDNDLISLCIDKHQVKKLIEWLYPNGELKTAKTLACFNSVRDFRDAGTDYLPSKFVIKCNHGSGYNLIYDNKQEFDFNDCVEKVRQWMKEDFWTIFAEPQYKAIKKRIIVEEYLGDNVEAYKFYCFNGEPKVVYISAADEAGNKDAYLDYYDMDWNHLDISLSGHQHYPGERTKPVKMDKMVEISKRLSSQFPFVRVDLYNIDEEIYLSELTFVPTGGYMKLSPNTVEREWGDWLKIN